MNKIVDSRGRPIYTNTPAWHGRFAPYAFLGIPIMALIVYANALRNPFVFDDKDFILARTFFYYFGNIPLLFSNQYHLMTGEATFRPLSVFPFFFDYFAFGLQPAGWRIFNILFHSLNGILVYQLIKTLSPKSATAAVLAGLAFVVHPALSETINVVGFNDDIQATTFFLISIILYIKVVQEAFAKPWLWISLLSYVMALLSKESVVILPLVLLAYETLRESPDRLAVVTRRQAPFWVATVAFLAAFFTIFKNHILNRSLPYLGGSFYTAVLNVPKLVISYVGFLIAPFQLTVLHGYSAWRELTLPVAGAFLFVAMLIFGCFLLWRRGQKNELLGVLLFLLALAPVLNLVPLGIPIAERYVYLPAVGAVLFLAFFGEEGASKIPGVHSRAAATGAATAVIVVLSILTVQRNAVFSSELSLWQDTVAKAPGEVLPMNNLAISYRQAGKTEKAIRIYKEAIELNPRWTGSYVNLGVALEDLGKPEEAERLYLKALQINPSIPQANNNLGGIYTDRGEPDKAIRYLLAAERTQPTNAVIQMNLGKAYELKGILGEALRRYQSAASLNPELTAAVENYNRLKASGSL